MGFPVHDIFENIILVALALTKALCAFNGWCSGIPNHVLCSFSQFVILHFFIWDFFHDGSGWFRLWGSSHRACVWFVPSFDYWICLDFVADLFLSIYNE